MFVSKQPLPQIKVIVLITNVALLAALMPLASLADNHDRGGVENVMEGVDYWFYPNTNWNKTMEGSGEELSAFKSVQAKKVFDYQGLGPNSWYERRIAEYYEVADDMCLTVGTRPAGFFERRRYWRNVQTEPVPPSGLEAECTAQFEANILADTSNDCSIKYGDSSAFKIASFGVVAGNVAYLGLMA